MQPVVDFADYDSELSISIGEARRLLRGKGGNYPSLDVVRRWCNPAHGCRPQGPDGPLLVLPALKVAREWRTMREWVRAFEKARALAGRPVVALEVRTAREARAAHRRAEEFLQSRGA